MIANGNHRVNFINVSVDALTKKEVFKRVGEFIRNGGYHYQISVNVAKLVYAQKDKRLLEAINRADIINADGVPIYIAAKKLSDKAVTRMGGLDYIEGLADIQPRWRYFFWGATQEVVEKVVQIYGDKFGCKIVGYRNGYFNEFERQDIINKINELHVDVLYLAVSSPTKEYFLHEMKHELNVKFAVGVGGAFDIIAGKTQRAPVWMQHAGLEWFYRILQEPRRMWKRYLVTNTLFIYYLVKEYLVTARKQKSRGNHKYPFYNPGEEHK